MEWVIWGVLLVLQQASHTASSRAKNSNNLWYSGTVGVFSNGVWFFSQFFIVGNLMKAQTNKWQLVGVGLFYIAFTVLGTLGAHWWLLRFEKRKGIDR